MLSSTPNTIEAGEFDLEVRDLGQMPYVDAFELQKSLQQAVIAGRETGSRRQYLLLVEHPAVITVSRRAGAGDHLLATEAQLAAAGVTVAATDRGGDITYHGPGQLVAYPILDLNRFGLRLYGYMRLLESAVIETLAHFDLTGARDAEATGVWIDPEIPGGGRKICAMGVRVSRWVSMHGLALNVAPDLRHFQLIVPCGLADRAVTSMAAELETAPELSEVAPILVEQMTRALTGA